MGRLRQVTRQLLVYFITLSLGKIKRERERERERERRAFTSSKIVGFAKI